MNKTALCTGSFDPITCGHEDVVRRAAALFDKVWVCVLVNADKTPSLTLSERVQMCREVFADLSNVEVICDEGMAVDVFAKVGADVIIRGVRGPEDLGYEMTMADFNRSLCGKAETLFMPCADRFRTVSSSLVRQLARSGQSLFGYVPDIIKDKVAQRLI